MKELEYILKNNQQWADSVKQQQPEFFKQLASGQKPEYLWIGCSDSRVPASGITGLQPGEVFVHRNIANVVHHNDLNVLSVLEFSVLVLKVKSILVCGHYGCGGVKAAMENQPHGMIDNWLRPIKETYLNNQEELDGISSEADKVNRLSELNVKEQVEQVATSTVVQKAWANGQQLNVHGMVYNLEDGLLKDLGVSKTQKSVTPKVYYHID